MYKLESLKLENIQFPKNGTVSLSGENEMTLLRFKNLELGIFLKHKYKVIYANQLLIVLVTKHFSKLEKLGNLSFSSPLSWYIHICTYAPKS